jgi:hypothetical protein
MKESDLIKRRVLKLIGFGYLLLGIIIWLFSFSGITGFVVYGDANLNLGWFLGVVFFIVGVVVLMAGRKKKSELEKIIRSEAHNQSHYQMLKKRLKYMQDYELEGIDPKDANEGVNLSRREMRRIKKIILKHLPKKLKPHIDEISISGSLSRVAGGERYKKFGIEGLKSDFSYLSDIDVSIYSKDLLDYLDLNWHEVIKNSGKGKNVETLRIVDDSHLNRRERHRLPYMNVAPEWIRDMVEEINSYKYCGKIRPVNIKVYKTDETGFERNVLYRGKQKKY